MRASGKRCEGEVFGYLGFRVLGVCVFRVRDRVFKVRVRLGFVLYDFRV